MSTMFDVIVYAIISIIFAIGREFFIVISFLQLSKVSSTIVITDEFFIDLESIKILQMDLFNAV